MYKFSFISLFITCFCSSQTLTVLNGSLININNNSSLSIDGLELEPSLEYIISGPINVNRTSAPIVVGDNSSINRVYTMTEVMSDYLGAVSFNYEDNELNGIFESELVLEVQDGNGDWTSVTPEIDENNNRLTYGFTEIIGFRSVTASDVSATLTVKPVLLDGYVRVYPNPTTDFLHIVSNTPQKATLFNAAGQKILEANSATALEVIGLPSGVYLLNLQNSQNQISTFKIIKK